MNLNKDKIQLIYLFINNKIMEIKSKLYLKLFLLVQHIAFYMTDCKLYAIFNLLLLFILYKFYL